MTVTQIAAVLGGWSVLIVGASSYLSKLLNERLMSKWRRDEQSTIEELRNAFSRESRILEAAIRGAQLGQDASHQKRIAAIERLWSALLAVRASFTDVVLFFEIFLPEEYAGILNRKDAMGQSLAGLSNESIVTNLQPIGNLEGERPHLGETLWSRISIYQSFMGRLAVLIVMGKQNGQIKDWREDRGVRQLLSVVLTEKTVDSVLGDRRLPALRWSISQLESLILEEISMILSGRRSAIESFENAKEVQRSLSQLKETTLGSDLRRFR